MQDQGPQLVECHARVAMGRDVWLWSRQDRRGAPGGNKTRRSRSDIATNKLKGNELASAGDMFHKTSRKENDTAYNLMDSENKFAAWDTQHITVQRTCETEKHCAYKHNIIPKSEIMQVDMGKYIPQQMKPTVDDQLNELIRRTTRSSVV